MINGDTNARGEASDEESKPRGGIRTGLIVLLAAVGIALSLAGFEFAKDWERDRGWHQTEDEIQGYASAIGRTATSDLDILHSIAALFSTAYYVSREDFTRFTANLMERGSGVKALEWIPRVPAEERDDYERLARKEGLTGFRITERDAGGTMVAAGGRAEYYPVFFVTPLEGNERALGFDLGSDPTRRAAMEKARDTGKLVASERIRLVQETGERFAVLAFLPLYRQGFPNDTVELRRKNLVGFALGVFRIGELVQAALKRIGSPHDVDIYVYAKGAPAKSSFLHFEPARTGPAEASPRSYEEIHSGAYPSIVVPIADRAWELVFRLAPGYGRDDAIWVPWLALGAGLMLTALLTLYLRGIQGRARDVETLVVTRTHQLQRANEGLRDSQKRYGDLIEGSVQGIMIDRNGVPLFANKAYGEIFGYRNVNELLMLESLDALYTPDEQPRIREYRASRLHGGSPPEHYEFQGVKKDGTRIWVENRASVVTWLDKPATQSTVIDVTERKRAVDALRRQALILDQMSDGVIVTGLDGIIIDWNKGAERMFGYAKEEVLGRSPALLDPTSLGDDQRTDIVGSLERDGQWAGEHSFVRKDGSEGISEVVILPFRDERGDLVAHVGVNRDITGRKRAEAELRDSERRLRAVLDNIIDGIVTIDERGTVESFSPSAESLFGYGAEEVIGRNVNMLMPEPFHGEHDSYLANYLRTGKARIIGIGREVVGRRKDGSTFPMELGVSEVDLEGRRIFTGIVRDITERKQIEQMKTEFVSTVSHELRTPLTSIKGSLGLIRGGVVGELPEKLRSMLDIAYNNSDRLVRLINDILDVEKIEAGKMDFQMKPLDLMRLVAQAVEANKGFAEEHGVTFEATEGVPEAKVAGDNDRLMQVMANLLSNAAKFSPEGGKVKIGVSRQKEGFRVSVTDQGPGIPDEFWERIFGKFAQADSSDTRQKGGTGLGLSITKAIVEHHGGTIGYETETGKGTTFYFDLPIWHEEASAVSADAEGTEGEPADGHRVLICEDDADVAALLRLILQQGGFAADIAGDAEEARGMLAETEYAAMTLDLMLPGMDGITFMRELREEPATRDLSIVVVSAKASDEKRLVNGDAIGVVDWIQKPIDEGRLLQALRRIPENVNGSKPRILHVEDDLDILRVVSTLIGDSATVIPATTLREGKRLLKKGSFDLVILDLNLPDGSGEDLMPLLHKGERQTPVIVFSAKEMSREIAQNIEAVLVKSQSSNEDLLAAVKSAIRRGRRQNIDKKAKP